MKQLVKSLIKFLIWKLWWTIDKFIIVHADKRSVDSELIIFKATRKSEAENETPRTSIHKTHKMCELALKVVFVVTIRIVV